METMTKRARGTGSLRKRKNGGWQISYYRDGTEVREAVARALGKPPSAVTRSEAERLLRRRLHALAAGTYVGPKAERLTVRDLITGYLADLGMRKGASAVTRHGPVTAQLAPLLDRRASTLTSGEVTAWIASRRAVSAPQTINHGVGLLSAAFRYAWKTERIARRPYLPRLPVKNARQGFFEREEFAAIARHLPAVFADLAWIAYLAGCRRGELLGLRWEHVDRGRGVILLVDTKNGDDRAVPLCDEAGALLEVGVVIERRWKARVCGGERLSAYVFHHDGLPYNPATFTRAWDDARTTAGLPGKLLHDCRRTFARDATDAGVSQAIVMKQLGQRSDSIFRRYRIVDARDLQRAQATVQAHRGGANVVRIAGAR